MSFLDAGVTFSSNSSSSDFFSQDKNIFALIYIDANFFILNPCV